MLVKLRGALAHHPLAGFFVLVGAAYLVFVGVVLASRPAFDALPWLNRYSTVRTAVAGLVALLCCWASSGPPTRPPRRFTQLFIVAVVVLVGMTALCVQTWLLWRMEWAALATAGEPPGVGLIARAPSLAQEIHHVLGDTVSWLRALVAGLVLAGVASQFSVVRRTSRALVAWRGRRVWLLAAVALLVPAACVAAARLGVRLVPAGKGEPVALHHTVAYTIATFAVVLLLSMPLVFAWYGFVAERLARRTSPLVIGLVVGAALVLPYQLAVWIVSVRFGLGFPFGAAYVVTIAGNVAVAVPAVWLARKAGGSLLPTALLLAATSAGTYFAVWNSSTAARLTDAQELYAAALMAAAVLFTLAGRMWRGTDAAPSPSEPHEPSPAPGSYDVVVHDVSMPL